MKTHLPSLDALRAPDNRLLRQELGCLAVREQATVVRGIAERLECLAPWGGNASLPAQLVEELARLGCRALEAAASLSETTDPSAGNGVLPALGDEAGVA